MKVEREWESVLATDLILGDIMRVMVSQAMRIEWLGFADSGETYVAGHLLDGEGSGDPRVVTMSPEAVRDREKR